MMDISRFILANDVATNLLIRIHLLGMKFFGYVIYDDQANPRLHCARGAFFTVSFIAFNVTQYVDLFCVIGNVEAMITNAGTTFLFTTTVSRMVNFYWNRAKYMELIREVHTNIRTIVQQNIKAELEILGHNIRYSKILTAIFWILALITGNMMCVNSLIQAMSYKHQLVTNQQLNVNETSFPPLIFRSYFPFDDLWANFAVIYAIQFYIMWLGLIIVPCWNAFFVALQIYAIVSLQILNHKLEHMHEYGQRLLAGKLFVSLTGRDRCDMDVLVQCVKKYREIAGFVQTLSDLGSRFLLLDFIIFSALLCTLLFQLSRALMLIQVAIFICYILTMIAILWMFYWHANEINVYSNQLTLSAYKSQWPDGSLVYKKSLLLFITSTKSLNMRTEFFVMTLHVFQNILRASYSYFTLLTQIA